VSGAPELAVEAVTKRFPGTAALDDVSLDVRAGEDPCGDRRERRLPEQIVTGVWPLTPDNLDQFKH
jgi:hypothetical protein